MAGDVRVVFSFSGEDDMVRTLLGFAERAEDLRPAWDTIEERFVAYEEAWFAGEGNGQWPPLSKDYAAWKAKHFPGEPLLVQTGTLKQLLTKPDIAVKEPAYAIFGTGDPIAGYHQRGGGNLPVRKVLDVDDDEIEAWGRVVGRYVTGADA